EEDDGRLGDHADRHDDPDEPGLEHERRVLQIARASIGDREALILDEVGLGHPGHDPSEPGVASWRVEPLRGTFIAVGIPEETSMTTTSLLRSRLRPIHLMILGTCLLLEAFVGCGGDNPVKSGLPGSKYPPS